MSGKIERKAFRCAYNDNVREIGRAHEKAERTKNIMDAMFGQKAEVMKNQQQNTCALTHRHTSHTGLDPWPGHHFARGTCVRLLSVQLQRRRATAASAATTSTHRR